MKENIVIKSKLKDVLSRKKWKFRIIKENSGAAKVMKWKRKSHKITAYQQKGQGLSKFDDGSVDSTHSEDLQEE